MWARDELWRETNFSIPRDEEGAQQIKSPLFTQLFANYPAPMRLLALCLSQCHTSDAVLLSKSALKICAYGDDIDITLGCSQDMANKGAYGASCKTTGTSSLDLIASVRYE